MIIILIIIVGFIIISSIYSSKWADAKFKEKARYSNDCREQGITLLKSGNYKEALEKLNESLRSGPSNLKNDDPYYYFGQCYFGLKQYDKVVSHRYWRRKEDELHLKALSAKELGDFQKLKEYIHQGTKINFEPFEKLKLQYFNISENANDFLQFIDSNTVFQLLRNVNEQDLVTARKEIFDILNEIKRAIQNPDTFKDGKLRLRELKYSHAKEVFKCVDLTKLLSKEYLYLNEEKRTGKHNNYVSHNNFYLSDLTFLRYFTNLKALNLFGQNKIINGDSIKLLSNIEEVNIGKSNIDPLPFEKDPNIRFVTDSSNLHTYSEYDSVENRKKWMKDLRLELSALSDYVKKTESDPYPKVLYPLNFKADIKSFNNGNFLLPQFDYITQSTKGKSEQQFYIELKNRFPNIVFDNVYFEHIEDYLPKFPDIALIDNKERIFIDIEIDEPYSLSTGEPIHYIGSDNDRNFDFLYNNWFVVRFSENQVVNYSHDCIRFIEMIYDAILLHKTAFKTDFNLYFPNIQRSWTKETAIKWSIEHYRLTYLK